MGADSLAIDTLIAEVSEYTKSGPERLLAMVGACRRIDEEKLSGDVVECGVWRGGNIILARKLCPDRVCWLYDTFDGMTEPGEHDRKKSGATGMESYARKTSEGRKWAAVSVEEVRQNLTETGTLDDALLRFVVGPVEATLLEPANLPDQIALLRLDTDWWLSTKTELEVLYPRMVHGGILIVDDYGHWLGARKAVDDYFLGPFESIMPSFERIDYTAVMMVKP